MSIDLHQVQRYDVEYLTRRFIVSPHQRHLFQGQRVSLHGPAEAVVRLQIEPDLVIDGPIEIVQFDSIDEDAPLVLTLRARAVQHVHEEHRDSIARSMRNFPRLQSFWLPAVNRKHIDDVCRAV